MSDELIPIGKIVRYQGKKGEVRLMPFIIDLDLNNNEDNVYTIDESGKALKRRALSIWSHRKLWVFHFEGINNIQEAQFLIGQKVAVDKSFFHKLPPGNYYWFEIIGLDVYDEKNEILGTIEDILFTGSNDVYVVNGNKKEELLIPATREIVKKIDLKENKMIIHLMEGL